MHVYVDYAHILKDVPYQVIECDIGHDSVDLLLLSHLQKQDILITQDYGLAALALGKGAYILHISGMEITSQNIDELLLRRYIGALYVYLLKKWKTYQRAFKTNTRR